MIDNAVSRRKKFPIWGWIGLSLVFVFWPLNWLLPGTRSIWAFFPLWTGYALTVDGVVFLRTGTSQIFRSKAAFASLFLISAPSWWLFEIINYRVRNWHYLGVEGLTPGEYFLLATINFSTVMPAVFGTAELLASTGLFARAKVNLRILKTKQSTRNFFLTGVGMLGLLLVWPDYFFPFVWVSVYFIIEPINVWLGNKSLADFTEVRDWRPILYLFAGALLTGFFWELWNYFSYPKWVYTIPYVGFAKIFEMPLLGYFGYLPFALELSALYQLFNGLLKFNKLGNFPFIEKVGQ